MTRGSILAEQIRGLKQPKQPKQTKRVVKKETIVNKPTPISLNEEQREAMRIINDSPISVLHGPAGTGKSMLAVFTALKYLEQGKVDKIVITRPIVALEDIGYMPGGIDEKGEDLYAVPLVDLINRMGVNPARGSAIDYYNALKATKKLEFVPIAFIRGRTFDNSFIIIDEAQNCSPHQIKTIISRIGKDSKMVFTGDTDQCDLNTKKVPVHGLNTLLQLTNHTKYVRDLMLITCMRNPIIEDLLKAWQNVKY